MFTFYQCCVLGKATYNCSIESIRNDMAVREQNSNRYYDDFMMLHLLLKMKDLLCIFLVQNVITLKVCFLV